MLNHKLSGDLSPTIYGASAPVKSETPALIPPKRYYHYGVRDILENTQFQFQRGLGSPVVAGS